MGTTLIFRYLTEAELALGEHKHELAAACLDPAEPLVRVTSEAQWHGAFGSLCGSSAAATATSTASASTLAVSLVIPFENGDDSPTHRR